MLLGVPWAAWPATTSDALRNIADALRRNSQRPAASSQQQQQQQQEQEQEQEQEQQQQEQ